MGTWRERERETERDRMLCTKGTPVETAIPSCIVDQSSKYSTAHGNEKEKKKLPEKTNPKKNKNRIGSVQCTSYTVPGTVEVDFG